MRLCLILLVILFAQPVHADAFIGQGSIFHSVEPKPGEPQGCISGSIGRRKIGKSDKDRQGIAFTVQEEKNVVPNKERSFVEFLYDPPGHKDNQYDDANGFGKIFTVCLRPGDYRLTYVRFIFTAGESWNETPYNIPFTVEAGKNTYIGSISLQGFIPKAFYAPRPPSVPDCNGGAHLVEISDQSARDLPLIMAGKHPPPSLPVVELLTPEPDNDIITRCQTAN
ncbi:hypothetical protein [Arenimonas oryziterrae]|nr:hypothetical protein [Arenimonas oryziterrae]